MNRVVIAAFREKPDALDAQRALASSDIASEVQVRGDALPRLCVEAFKGGFDVVVDERDADSGIALLQRMMPDERVIDVRALDRCPECGSTEVFRLPRVLLFCVAAAVLVAAAAWTEQYEMFLVAVAVIALLLALAPARRCRACGNAWR